MYIKQKRGNFKLKKMCLNSFFLAISTFLALSFFCECKVIHSQSVP